MSKNNNKPNYTHIFACIGELEIVILNILYSYKTRAITTIELKWELEDKKWDRQITRTTFNRKLHALEDVGFVIIHSSNPLLISINKESRPLVKELLDWVKKYRKFFKAWSILK